MRLGVRSRWHHKRSTPEFVWNHTETTVSKGSWYVCFDPHLSAITVWLHGYTDGYIQQDNAPCHRSQIISNWLLEYDNEVIVTASTALKWPQSHQIAIQQSIFVMWGNVKLGQAANKSAATVWWYRSNMYHNLSITSSILLNLCHANVHQYI